MSSSNSNSNMASILEGLLYSENVFWQKLLDTCVTYLYEYFMQLAADAQVRDVTHANSLLLFQQSCEYITLWPNAKAQLETDVFLERVPQFEQCMRQILLLKLQILSLVTGTASSTGLQDTQDLESAPLDASLTLGQRSEHDTLSIDGLMPMVKQRLPVAIFSGIAERFFVNAQWFDTVTEDHNLAVSNYYRIRETIKQVILSETEKMTPVAKEAVASARPRQRNMLHHAAASASGAASAKSRGRASASTAGRRQGAGKARDTRDSRDSRSTRRRSHSPASDTSERSSDSEHRPPASQRPSSASKRDDRASSSDSEHNHDDLDDDVHSAADYHRRHSSDASTQKKDQAPSLAQVGALALPTQAPVVQQVPPQPSMARPPPARNPYELSYVAPSAAGASAASAAGVTSGMRQQAGGGVVVDSWGTALMQQLGPDASAHKGRRKPPRAAA
jgi:hypothetical protein